MPFGPLAVYSWVSPQPLAFRADMGISGPPWGGIVKKGGFGAVWAPIVIFFYVLSYLSGGGNLKIPYYGRITVCITGVIRMGTERGILKRRARGC